MANEVIIEEYASTGTPISGGANVPIPGVLIKTQTLNIATQSAAFADNTAFIRVQSKGTGFWFATGQNGLTVTAATSPARWVPADQFRDIAVGQDKRLQSAA